MTNSKKEEAEHVANVTYTLYRRRWVVLALYVLFCMANAMQWIQYAIIADVIMKYYGVSASAVNWTSLVYMLVYIILIFPATWLYNRVVSVLFK
jgi:FLVCR family feline leukemia virus subgroup C receptor-related protein